LAAPAWPLEELNLSHSWFCGFGAGSALAALPRLLRLRSMWLDECDLSAAGFKALVEAAWPALTNCSAGMSNRWHCAHAADFMERWTLKSIAGGHDALGAAVFAGFPALEVLDLSGVALGEVGAALLASRRWARLRVLRLHQAQLGDSGLAALARGEFPALEQLCLSDNGLGAPLALEDARRWAPALVHVF
jgi:hypothetical protein